MPSYTICRPTFPFVQQVSPPVSLRILSTTSRRLLNFEYFRSSEMPIILLFVPVINDSSYTNTTFAFRIHSPDALTPNIIRTAPPTSCDSKWKSIKNLKTPRIFPLQSEAAAVRPVQDTFLIPSPRQAGSQQHTHTAAKRNPISRLLKESVSHRQTDSSWIFHKHQV